jgi:hypothetical protein
MHLSIGILPLIDHLDSIFNYVSKNVLLLFFAKLFSHPCSIDPHVTKEQEAMPIQLVERLNTCKAPQVPIS